MGAALCCVVRQVQAFNALRGTKEQQHLLAAGSAGIEAATNIVVCEVDREMHPGIMLSRDGRFFIDMRYRGVRIRMRVGPSARSRPSNA